MAGAEDKSPHAVSEKDIEWGTRKSDHGKFECRYKRLGAEAKSKHLGCNLMEVDPGKSSCPFHWHLAMEEVCFLVAPSVAENLEFSG